MAIEMQTTDLTREALITAAGEPAYLASLTTLGRTSMILSNLLHTASEADAWPLVAACRWLLGRMTVCGLHSSKKSQKAVQAQVARLVDAALERAKVEAAEAEALMLASQASANIERWERQLFDEPIESWVASLNAPPNLPDDLFPDSLLEQSEISNGGRCGWCGRYDCICDQEPEPPEPTTPASAAVPQVYGDEAGFLLFCARGDFIRDLTAAHDAILARFDEVMVPCIAAVEVLSDEALDLEDWDEADEWEAFQRERAYKQARALAA